MRKLNKIDWSKVKLYHGTTEGFLTSILNEDQGFYIPKHDGNWLGRGTYFAVNNIFLPILYSHRHKIKRGGEPAILEINAKYLANDIRDRILDLTTQKGLNIFHSITNDFVDFVKPYERFPELKKELDLIESHFAGSPLYSEEIKPHLIPKLEWFVLAITVKPDAESLDTRGDDLLQNLKQTGEENITNLILDWFNFKFSSGIEKDVPIRGVMANFNSGQGTPILLANVLKGRRMRRSFADYISYLNRTELVIFGYDYYRAAGHTWNFKRLFREVPEKGKHFKTYIGIGPIESLIEDSFRSTEEFGFKMDRKAIGDLFNLLVAEHDTN